MQKQNQDSQSPALDQLVQSAREIQSGTLASAGRRRTQEQGQGDLDDDRQDPAPVAVPEEVPSPGQSDSKRS